MNKHQNERSQKKRPDSFILRFTGVAFTMGAAIALFTYGGIRLDEHLQNKTPWATIAGALFGLTAGFYLVIKDLNRK